MPSAGLPRWAVVEDWETDLDDRAEELFPSPAAVPAELPAVAGAWARADKALTPLGLAVNTYSAVVVCGATCHEADVTVYAGHTRFPANSVDLTLQDQAGRSLLFGVDGSGLPAARYLLDARYEAPFPVLPATETPEASPSTPAATTAAALRWTLPGAEAVAGAGLLATLAAALYYLWPVAKSGAAGLFSRIAPQDVLGNPSRARLLALIEANPGLHFQELARRTGFGRGQLDHHLRRLQAAGLVSRVQGSPTRATSPAATWTAA